MMQLTRSGFEVDRQAVPTLHSQFQDMNCIRLIKLLHPDLLDFLAQRLAKGSWCERVHKGIGVEYVLDDIPARSLLHFLTNNLEFRSLIEEVTGCGPLTIFGGRVYRLVPNSGHFDSWHDDVQGGRLVGMSLNLSFGNYQGGRFLLRERQSGRMFAEFDNTGIGDALIFRISDRLEHRVSDIEGDEPKTAFAGWFQASKADFFSQARANRRPVDMQNDFL